VPISTPLLTHAPATWTVTVASARWRTATIWLLTLVTLAGTLVYQRRTGPTYPYRTAIDIGETAPLRLRLLRSAETTGDALIVIPNPGGRVSGRIAWHRYNTPDPWTMTPLVSRPTADGTSLELVGRLPAQPPAGKIEYRLALDTPRGGLHVPASGSAESSIVLRFKGPVPAWLLVPHIAGMFLALLFGLRAGLGAIGGAAGWSRFVWATLLCGTIGGMLLGPLVQKAAFNAYWTGFPFGTDLTDNKTLAQWLGWIAAALLVWHERRAGRSPESALPRVVTAIALALMLAVYLVPHSLRGSELDYNRLEQLRQQHGATFDPTKAIGTGW
jgi:hypothetical protein